MLATRKGASREGWSEGSVVQNRDLTNRNRIGGGQGVDERAADRKVHIHQDAVSVNPAGGRCPVRC